MKTTTTYQKVASYEATGKLNRVLLLFSGGVDTSTMLKWIQDKYQAEVITLTLDIGQQGDDLEAIRNKALRLGAKEAIVYDAKDRFADEVIAKGIKANARYQGEYHLSTPMGRVITSQIGVEIAKEYNCDAIAHGSTGKGNDQVRFDAYSIALNPEIKIIAPVREWNMDRDEQIAFAEANDIDIPANKDFPYSVDDNMWGMTWEGGEIEDPSEIPKVERFLTTYTRPENAPDQAEYIKIEFLKGLPISLDGQKMKLSEIISKLNKIGGKHGVGVVHLLEDRLIGLKDRGVYELPGGHILIRAHEELEKYTNTRTANELKAYMDIKWGYLCYAAQWFDPVFKAINDFNDSVNERVNGVVTVKLYKGVARPVAIDSSWGMGHASFTTKRGYNFNVNASAGFIEIYSLQMKIAQEIEQKNTLKEVNFQAHNQTEEINSNSTSSSELN